MKEKLRILRSHWGKMPLCNECPQRAPHIGSFCFPLCWRCTALCGTLLVAVIFLQWLRPMVTLPRLIPAGLCGLPVVIDGVAQYGFGRESTNIRRCVTGILGGGALGWLVYSLNVYWERWMSL